MGGELNHTTVRDMDGWMRNVERRMLTQERRSSEFAIQRRLGEGVGKYAKQIFDWNTENTWLYGQYWSDVGSLHSPNGAIPWLGTTKVSSDLGGIQEVVALDGSLAGRQRTFTFNAGGIPVFTAWVTGVATGNFGGFTAQYNGGWPTAVPGPTDGSSMSLPAGVLRATVGATGFTASAGALAVQFFWDGVLAQTSTLAVSNAALNAHTTMPTVSFTVVITAGTHYIYFRQIAGVSDSGDLGFFYGTVLPA